MSKVLFSVVIACYNHEDFVRTAVESVLSQKHPNTEVIVVDDGSSDRTPEILDSFGKSILFARLAVNRGASAARNHGVSLASGDYVVFLDGDDALMPWTLEVYSRLVASREPAIILGRSARCAGRLPDLTPGDFPVQIKVVEYPEFLSKDRPWLYNSSSLVVRRAALLAAGGWSEDIFYQDIQDLLNKMAVSGRALLVLAPDTVWYRMHSTNAIRKVQPFIEGIYVLLAKSGRGLYPGGQEIQSRRSIWFGGLIFYWTMEAFRGGFYRDGMRLLASGWWMILLAVVRRGVTSVTGRRPVETLPFGQG